MRTILKVVLSYFLTFCGVLNAFSNPCSQAVISNSPNQRGIPTPSENFLDGMELAIAAVAASKTFGKGSATEIFQKFQHDPRYTGDISTQPEDLLKNAIKYIENSYPPSTSNEKKLFYTFVGAARNYRLDYLVTWKPLGIRAINLLISNRIYPVGLSNRDQYNDGKKMTPSRFFAHDISHAISIEEYFQLKTGGNPHPIQLFFTNFLEEFNYESIKRNLNPKDQMLFDFAYFIYLHEGFGMGNVNKILNAIKKINNPLQKRDIHDIYKNIWFLDYLKLEFKEDDTLSVLPEYPPNMVQLMHRFLDKNDLLPQLPIEVQDQIAATPREKYFIIHNFIISAFNVFLNQHYQVIKKILKLN